MVVVMYFVFWLFWSLVVVAMMPLIWSIVCVPIVLLVPEDVCSDSSRFGLAALVFFMMLASTPVLGLILTLTIL